VYIDLSWSETAKYLAASPEAIAVTAELINLYPDRFLFGSDEVAPASLDPMVKVYDTYAPLWAALSPEARSKVLTGNYERIFDAARVKVRA
jgi:predicted TIM-barrel fold metal-dependent hydrolase